MKIVLQKFIAESGYCSRRKAEDLIKNGRNKVLVNGVEAELGMRVDDGDEILINGKILKKDKKVYIKMNKPVGFVCSNKSFLGEKSVFDLLPVVYRDSLHIVGRLDKNSRGLVILTNDGDFTQKMTNPKFNHKKKYFVKTNVEEKNVGEILKSFKKGFEIMIDEENFFVKVFDIIYLGKGIFEIFLAEGKKRQIRKMFEAFDVKIFDLKRLAISSFELENLREGSWEFFEI